MIDVNEKVLQDELDRLGIRGKVTKYTKRHFLEVIVDELISTGKILPYYQYREYRYKIEIKYEFKKFDDLSRSNKEIVKNAIEKEPLLRGIGVFKFVYSLVKVNHSVLPSSIWADVYEVYMAGSRWNTIVLAVYKIYVIERSIMKIGIKSGHPIIVQDFKNRRGEFIEICGGNHRLQAIRNLIERGSIDDRDIDVLFLKKM